MAALHCLHDVANFFSLPLATPRFASEALRVIAMHLHLDFLSGKLQNHGVASPEQLAARDLTELSTHCKQQVSRYRHCGPILPRLSERIPTQHFALADRVSCTRMDGPGKRYHPYRPHCMWARNPACTSESQLMLQMFEKSEKFVPATQNVEICCGCVVAHHSARDQRKAAAGTVRQQIVAADVGERRRRIDR